jgi:hypothetical protein
VSVRDEDVDRCERDAIAAHTAAFSPALKEKIARWVSSRPRARRGAFTREAIAQSARVSQNHHDQLKRTGLYAGKWSLN